MRYVLIPILILSAAGCATVEGGGPAFNMLTTQEEVEIGTQMAAQVEKQAKTLDDSVIQQYVRNIGQRLAQYAPRQDVSYIFTVIDDPDAMNAFALPGGHLYIFTGLLRFADNEAELAGVMAHEIAHVALQHHGQAISRQYARDTIQSMLLGESAAPAAQMAASLLNQGLGLRFSRENERQADALAMNMLYQAGYNPGGMLTFMDKMLRLEAQEGPGPSIPLLSSHPATSERIARLQGLMAQFPPNVAAQTAINRESYHQVVLSRLNR
jgi:predicted Zn-dependent protease